MRHPLFFPLLLFLLCLCLAGCSSPGTASENSGSILPEPSSLSAVEPPRQETPEAEESSAGALAPSFPLRDNSDDPDPFDTIDDDSPNEPPNPEESSSASGSGDETAETRNRAEIKADMLAGIEEWKTRNSDTVGWLYVPETTLDSPVFQSSDNLFYLKHNDDKTEDKNGAIMADYRDVFGGREQQSQNLVLYAHSKDEDPDGGVEASREFEHFTELKRYQDIEFCRRNPYVMFAADGDAMVWQIFAVFHTKTDFNYIRPNPTQKQMDEILAEARQKSLFNFDVEVSDTDRILTLSTCCRRIVPTYPNGYRFVVMARLVEKGLPLTYDSPIAENPGGLSPANVYE